jgi:hypothetical protein
MTRWPEGERTVEFLLGKNRLEAIATEDLAATAEMLVERAHRRVATASAALALGDIDGAYAAAYDAYRISAEALLTRQALRATGGEGSHMAVEDAAAAQFAEKIPAFAKPMFERMRRTRHSAQYFDPSAAPIEEADAKWAIEKAAAAIDGARSVLASGELSPFS